jgi:acetyl-CoA carboxylase carboxyl transferase subunit alpha
MPLETLEFEEPIGVLLKEIEALAQLPRTDAGDREIESLRRRVETVRGDLYRTLTPWQRVMVARHPNRPGLEDIIPTFLAMWDKLTTDKTVLAIALESGFGSLARFYAAFTRECGMSPGEFRKRGINT